MSRLKPTILIALDRHAAAFCERVQLNLERDLNYTGSLIKSYSRPPVILVQSRGLLIAGYMVLTLPYMYRAIDAGLRATNVKTLTEAAQSLGAGWPRIIWQVIVTNVRGALVNGAFLTFANLQTYVNYYTLVLLYSVYTNYMYTAMYVYYTV